MQNILIGVKRFFKNKNTVTIIGVIVCLGILYFVYDMRIKRATNPTTVAYAKVVIGPRTYITSDMVSTKKVPGELAEGIYTLPSQVIGKYVMNDAVIPINGLFYQDYIGTWDQISDTIYDSIENDHTIFALEVTKNNTYGNSIYPGNYIDLYYKQDLNSGGNIVIGKFIEGIKVLAVTDGNGRNVFETAGNPGNPKYIIFSVDEEMHLLLKKTKYVADIKNGDLFPVPRNKDYSTNNKNVKPKVVNSEIKTMILDATYDVPLVNLDGNGGVN